MKKVCFVSSFLLLFVCGVHAQFSQNWLKTINNNGFREYYNVQSRLDNSGNTYVAAGFYSQDSILNSNGQFTKHPAGFVVIKYSSTLSQTWVKSYESAFCDFKSLHVTTTGEAFVAVTESVTNEGKNARLYKYSSAGTLASNYPLNYNSGGASDDEAFGVVTDNSNNFVYLAATDSFGTANQGVVVRRYSNVTSPIVQWTKLYNNGGTAENGLQLILNNGEPVVIAESFSSSKDFILLSYAASSGNFNFATSITQDASYSDVRFCTLTRSTSSDLYVGLKGINTNNSNLVEGVSYKYSFGGLLVNTVTLASSATQLDDKLRLIDLSGSIVMLMSNGSNLVAQKFDASNNPTWSPAFTASNFSLTDAKSELGVQSAVYVIGTQNDLTTEGFDNRFIKINTTGSQVYSQVYDNASFTSSEISSSLSVTSLGVTSIVGVLTETATSTNKVFSLLYSSAGAQTATRFYFDNTDNTRNVITDASGNVYVSGNSTDASNLNDIYVSKYNSSGVLQWNTRVGISTKDETTSGRQLAIDNAGNLFVVGTVVNATTDVLIACLKSSNGALKFYSSYNGTGSSFDIPYAIASDGSGNVYITGETRVSGTNRNAMLLKYSSTGSQLVATSYEGTAAGNDIGRDITIDSFGTVYIAAESNTLASASSDITLLKYSSAGSFVWARSIQDANGSDLAGSVKILSVDSILICGTKFNASLNTDALVASYTSAGVLNWSTVYNSGTNNETGTNLSINQFGAIAVTGQSNSSDVLVWKLNPNGSTAFAQTYNGAGSGNDFERGCYINSSGNIFVGGYFRNTLSVDDGMLLHYDNSGTLVSSAVVHVNSTNQVQGVFFDQLGKAFLVGSTNNTASTDGFIASYNIPFTDLAPVLTSVSDQSTCGSVVGPLSFQITDESAATVNVVGTSSNTSVISNSNIVVSGSGANRTVSITPTTNQTGNVTITLTATDAGNNSATTTFAIDVKSLPVKPVITADASLSFCAGGSVNLTSSYATGNTWSTASTSNSILVNTSSSITVSVSNTCGTSTSDPVTTQLLSSPIAPTISASGSTTFCAGGSVSISGNTGGTWNIGGNDASITATSSGSYFVTSTNSCGSTTSNTINVTVHSLPTPSINGSSSFCPSSSTTLSTSQSYNAYVWTGNVTSSTLSVNTAGTYQVVVTDANGCSGNASVNISACISTVPNTQLRSVDCGKLNLVPGSQVACNAVAGATNYEFEFRDVVTNAVYATRVTTSTILAPGVVVPALNWNTQYQCRVRARVGGVWGNFSTSCIIGMAPNPAVVGVANTKLSAKWCNKSNIGLATTIDCIQISMANRYEFEFTDVLTSAVSTIQQSSKYLVLSSVTPALVAGHTYQVKVRARVSTTWGSFSDVCTLGIASSARYAEPEAVSTSTDETDETFAENAFEVKLYPNPVSTFMSLQMNKLPEENASVSIYNSIGALMYSAKLLNASQEIELSSLSAGIYFVFIQNGNETQNTRIIKK